MKTLSAEWQIVSQIPGEKWYAARLYYGNSEKYLSIASKDFVLNDEKFLGIITNQPSIGGGFDIQTRENKINSGVIEVMNQIDQITTFGELASTLGSGNDIGFENRRVDLRLMKEGISKFENGYPMLTNGRMYRPEYGPVKATIKIEDNSKNRLGSLGKVVTDDDARSGYSLPSISAGRIKPIIYGDHIFKINPGASNALTKEDWEPFKQPRLIPMINLNGGYWMVEDHAIAGTPQRLNGQNIWARNTQTGKIVELSSGYSVISNDDTGVVLDVGLGAGEWAQYDRPISVSNEGSSNWSNPDNAIDGLIGTGATISITGAGNNGIMRYVFPEFVLAGGFEGTELYLIGEGDWGAMNQLFCDGDLLKYYTPAVILTTFVNQLGGGIDEADTDIIDLTFRAGGGATVDAEILDVYRRVAFSTNNIEWELLWGGLGHEIDAWADAANRSSHFNFGDSGDPATNPATCIESICRNDMGLVDADIDMDSFDQASNDLAASMANFDIRTKTNLKLFLSQMGVQFRSIVPYTTDSKVRMLMIQDEYTSADVIIDYVDMAELKFNRTDDDQLTSKVSVEYGYDGAKYLNKTDEVENTVTQTRYDLSELATERELLADKINDEVSADDWGDFHLAFWQEHHNGIERISLDESFLGYEPGDIIGLKDVPEDKWPNGEDITRKFTRAGQEILPFFMITDFVDSDRALYQGIQMHKTG